MACGKQGTVFRGTDTPVILEFSFTGEFAALGLNNFTSIELSIGGETYTTSANPSELIINSTSELRLIIGATTSLGVGNYQIEVTGFSTVYNDGYVLINSERNRSFVEVV